jgi:hypothetical protein
MKNWAHTDIKFKELIDYGFPLPTFTFNGRKSTEIQYFSLNGWRGVEKNPFQNSDLFSKIEKKLNYSLDLSSF